MMDALCLWILLGMTTLAGIEARHEVKRRALVILTWPIAILAEMMKMRSDT